MAEEYKGRIQHTEHTIELMFQVAYHTYEKLKMLVRAAVGAGMVVLAVLAGLPLIAQGIIMLIGCWLLISPDFPAACRADRAVTARKGVLPVMSYTFRDSGIKLKGEGAMEIGYDKLQRLVEDDGYLYLFLGKGTVCMVDKGELIPQDPDGLKQLLEEKTGLRWGRDKSLISMTGQDLVRAIRDRRQR